MNTPRQNPENSEVEAFATNDCIIIGLAIDRFVKGKVRGLGKP